jgi:hypothetical protein
MSIERVCDALIDWSVSPNTSGWLTTVRLAPASAIGLVAATSCSSSSAARCSPAVLPMIIRLASPLETRSSWPGKARSTTP